jgi:hypothetical protein
MRSRNGAALEGRSGSGSPWALTAELLARGYLPF